MKRLATTLAQSRQLVALGLDPATCDFVYTCEEGPFVFTGDLQDLALEDMTPAWTTEALLALLPSGTTFLYSSRKGWHIEFVATNGLKGEIHYDSLKSTTSALDAVYGLVAWLLESGHIRKGGAEL